MKMFESQARAEAKRPSSRQEQAGGLIVGYLH